MYIYTFTTTDIWKYFFSELLRSCKVDETNQPEDEDKNEEKYRVKNLHKILAEINLPVTATLF